VLITPKSAGHFRIGEAPKHTDFPGCPSTRTSGQSDASDFPFGDGFLDSPFAATCESRVGCLTEPFKLARSPWLRLSAIT
jgi:hypothetical protein